VKQVVQNYKTGEVKLIEAPPPLVKFGGVLVRNANSVVSLGTEKLIIHFARKSLLGKALARPDLTRQVIDLAKNEGLTKAYRQAMSRLDNLTPLGYSSAGVVLEVGEGVEEFRIGERVACARGGFASHAEIVFVPKNLCAKIPDNVDFESAAFATLGAIPLHAIRLCELGLGENIAIIGLGLLGQLAVQLAKAAGYRVLGIDTDDDKVSLAQKLGADDGAVIDKKDAISKARSFSKGYGFDAVLILASSTSNQPLEIATEICREKGRIVAPGMVKLDVPRETFYHKELSLIVSRAWGPGFDDAVYELKGIDYPLGYIRWTERRNMEQFLELVAEGRVQLAPLITHRFKIDEADRAYKAMTEDASGKYIGVLLCYDVQEREALATKVQLKKEAETKKPKEKINVGLIGAGTFATGTMLPLIKKLPSINLRGVATATGPSGKHAGDKFGFEYCTTDYDKVLKDPEIDCVLIATRHNLHAKLVIEGLNHGKDVFVEKPLALSPAELKEVIATYKQNSGRLMVGFNRRFSPFSLKAKEFLSDIDEPLVINCRVNAGFIPKESWVHDPSEGGGRILGEVCHFVDLAQFLTGSLPVKVYAETLSNPGIYAPDENVVITITFKNSSLASITYVANGDKAFPRERVEIFGGGSVCVIDNFRSLVFTKGSKKKRVLKLNKDSGHRAEFSAFFSAIQKGGFIPVDFEEYIYTTLATFSIQESLSKGIPIEVNPTL
jgi:predicted dehydrogenase/threonine dehydrogenase-like Zn-dependent dehydrogenase